MERIKMVDKPMAQKLKANSPDAKKPDDCQTMAEVRIGVDAIDRELVRLLVTRQGYMHAAARIKPNRAAACICLLYTSPSPRDLSTSRMPSSA